MQYNLSKDEKRNKIYNTFLESVYNGESTVNDLIQMGYKLMRKYKLHPHFFMDNTLLSTAQYLASYALGNAKDLNEILTIDEATKIIALFERRIDERIPVEYITHEAQYAGFTFYVNEHVLVPRSIMSTRFTDFLNAVQWDNYRVLDLCTGSGCIGITLALLAPNIQVDLVDISAEALEVARINVNNFKLDDRVNCIQSDLFSNVKNKYDLIITNPPYVSSSDYNKTPAEFKNEPKIALESGKDGLELTNRIITQAKDYLNPNGTLIAEVGYISAKRVKKKYPKIPFKWFKYRTPEGKESFFGMHGVFMCKRSDLIDY